MKKVPFAHKPEAKDWYGLLKKNGYVETVAKNAAPKLEGMDPDLKEALVRWDEIGELPSVEVEGFTVQGLTEYKGLHVIAAFLMLNWLRRAPEEAKEFLAQPIDTVDVTDELRASIEYYDETDCPENLPEEDGASDIKSEEQEK